MEYMTAEEFSEAVLALAQGGVGRMDNFYYNFLLRRVAELTIEICEHVDEKHLYILFLNDVVRATIPKIKRLSNQGYSEELSAQAFEEEQEKLFSYLIEQLDNLLDEIDSADIQAPTVRFMFDVVNKTVDSVLDAIAEEKARKRHELSKDEGGVRRKRACSDDDA